MKHIEIFGSRSPLKKFFFSNIALSLSIGFVGSLIIEEILIKGQFKIDFFTQMPSHPLRRGYGVWWVTNELTAFGSSGLGADLTSLNSHPTWS